MARPDPGREALWREVERELRRFARAFDSQPEWLWEPETQQLMRAVRPRLALLDGPSRARQDGPAPPGGSVATARND